MVAITTGESNGLDVLFECEGVSVLDHLNLLKFNVFNRRTTLLTLRNVGILFTHYKVVLKLPKLKPLLLDPHKVGI